MPKCYSSRKARFSCLVYARKYEQGKNPVIMSYRRSVLQQKKFKQKKEY